MAQLPQTSLPAACGNCLTTTQLAQPGVSPQESPWNLHRAGDGRTRLDAGDMSVITDPAAQKRIVLDHLAREARVMPMSPDALKQMAPAGLGLGGMPNAAPPGSAMDIKELGKRMIDGHECDGRRYLLQPPGHGLSPTTIEVWASSKLHLPVLTTTTGSFGQQTSRCSPVPGEPDASKFQIPPGYKQIQVPPAPAMPNPPGIQR